MKVKTPTAYRNLSPKRRAYSYSWAILKNDDPMMRMIEVEEQHNGVIQTITN